MSAPPNHDPNASLLQGGNSAQIQPVMGGGGIAPPNHNADASLLRGGEGEPIQPIMGGGPAAPPPQDELLEAPDEATSAKAAAAATLAAIITLRSTQDQQKAYDAAVRAGNDVIRAATRGKDSSIKAGEAQKILNATTQEEKEAASEAAKNAYTLAKADGKSDEEAMNESVRAAVFTIKDMRKKNKPPGGDEAPPLQPLKPEETIPKRPAIISRLKDEINTIYPDPIYCEFYKLMEINDVYRSLLTRKREAIKSNQDMRDVMKFLGDEYEARYLALWNSNSLLPAGYSAVPTLPTSGAFDSLRARELLMNFSRLTYVLPVDTKDIVVIPPIQGDDTKFLKVLQTLESMGVLSVLNPENGPSVYTIRKNTVVVFTAPYFTTEPLSEEATTTSFLLMAFFLEIERTNRGQIFILAEQTSENFAIGNFLHSVRGSPSPKHTLLNMLQPSYIVYPYLRGKIGGIALSSSRLLEKANIPAPKSVRASSLENLYGSRIFGKAAGLVYKPNIDKETALGYFVVRSDAAEGGSFAIPNVLLHERGICEDKPALQSNFDLNANLATLFPDRRLPMLPESESIVVLRLRSGAEYTPLCAEKAAKAERAAKDTTQFIGSEEAFADHEKVLFQRILVNGQIFRIRLPVQEVVDDWKSEIYTDEEAAFLNSLNLRPVMMEDIFPQSLSADGQPIGRSWQEEVARFLENIVNSKCFDDDTLMTLGECMATREFMSKVYFYFVEKSLRSDTLGDFEHQRAEYERNRRELEDELNKQREFRSGSVMPQNSEARRVVSADDFAVHKKTWNQIDIWDDAVKKEKVAYIMMINKRTGEQEYRAVGVPVSAYPDDAIAKQGIEKKIEDLRRKYKGYFFVY